MPSGKHGWPTKRALITGGAGLVGSHIADGLVKAGVSEIVILDNVTRGRRENLGWALANGPVTLVEGNIGDRDLLASVMRGIDVVFHQAAIRITQCAEEPRLAHEVLVDGTFNVVEAAVQAGVEKVVAGSSAAVYGVADEFPTPECHHPYNNRTLYGAAKLFNEALLRSFNEMYGLRYVALRYFNIYGPRMAITGEHTEVLIRWMDRIVTRQSPVIFGDGKQLMDFVYVEDVARANILAWQAETGDEVLNIASGVETSLNDLAEILLRVMHSPLKPEYRAERSVNPVPRRLGDTRKAERLLGFKTRVSLDEGLSRLFQWWKAARATEGMGECSE